VKALETLIRETIAAEGPMRLDRYMALCLGHPRHGYYMTRDPFGAGGDFVTAPEISQLFGELVGVVRHRLACWARRRHSISSSWVRDAAP
jgi:SAM-dependent MidA family methyltransferase